MINFTYPLLLFSYCYFVHLEYQFGCLIPTLQGHYRILTSIHSLSYSLALITLHLTSMGFDHLTFFQANNFLKESGVDIIPSYMVADKQSVKEGDRPKWTKKNNLPEVTASWHNYMKREVVRDFQQTLLHCSEAPYDEDTIMSIPTEPYEFPSGYNNVRPCFVLSKYVLHVFF